MSHKPVEESIAFFVGKTTGVAMLALPTRIVFPQTENFVFLRAYVFAFTVVIIIFGDDSSPSSEGALLPSVPFTALPLPYCVLPLIRGTYSLLKVPVPLLLIHILHFPPA